MKYALMEKSAQRVTKRNKIVESYLVEKEVYYPSSPDRVITRWEVPEFVMEDGRIMSGEYEVDGCLFFRDVTPEEKKPFKVVFMNVPLCTVGGEYSCKEISTEEAKALCLQADEFGSAIGHSGAAEAISALLDVECPVNRIQYEQPVGEHVIVIKLLSRMPEGCGNLTKKQMDEIGFKWYHLERLS